VNGPHEFKVMRLREAVADADLIDTPERAVSYWQANVPKAEWYDPDKEAFVVLVLNTRKRILGHNLVTLGSLDTCHVHPREVFRPIIMISGSCAILAHNHPSGDPTPSEADIKVTRDLIRAGQLLKIEILDHVIVGRATPEQPQGWVSLRTLGYFF
jgi:DNA repair protein RadC